MNRNEHFGVGFVVVVAIHVLFPQYLRYAGIPLLFGCVTPDLIEPATHWRHRKFFHSKTLLNKLILFTLASLVVGLFWNPLLYVGFFAFGYIIHLMSDTIDSEMGLPE